MLKKTSICIALSALFVGGNVQAATIYEKDNGDKLELYGEVGVGGHIGADFEYGEFYEDDKNYIDDSFATLGVVGNNGQVYYRLEVDYERENWEYGTGDMVLTIDKVFIGYTFADSHAIEFGLTDTALDDYDAFGDFTFDTSVETGEAGDQENTIKYEGSTANFRMGASYSYEGESESGSEQGDILNGYIGYFTEYADIVIGAETRLGSEGESKYGEQVLLTLGARIYITDEIAIGVNGYYENEDIAQDIVKIAEPDFDDETPENIYAYNDYQTLTNKGALISARYKFNQKITFTASANYEAYEAWDINSAYGVAPDDQYSWGKERIWGTLGINFKPSNSIILALEANVGEAAQDAYAYARVYF